MAATTPKVINSVQRAISILNLFDEQTGELGVTEIAEKLGLHKSTAAGLIYTLEHYGYLEQEPETRKYHLGFKLVERAFTLLDQIDIREIALPHLQELRDWCNESVNLALRDGGQIVYVARLETTQSLGMHSKVGHRTSMHSTALGKAILSCIPVAEVEEIIAQYGMPALTVKTITEKDELLQELVKVREQGFALDNEEREIGGRCVAAPVFDHMGQAVAAISVSAPIHRIPMAEVTRYGIKVRDTALAISHKLGYRLPEQDM